MLTLEFRDELVNNPFSYSNHYNYGDIKDSGIFLNTKGENPFITRATLSSISNRLHFEQLRLAYGPQLNGRVITAARFKEILDSSRFPLALKYVGKEIYLGKGFISLRSGRDMGRVLFVACESAEKAATNLNQIRYYVSRLAFTEEYKKIGLIIRSVMDVHTGEVLMADDIDQYIGRKIDMPKVSTITQKKEFVTRLITHCIQQFCKQEKEFKEPSPKKEKSSPPKEKREGVESLSKGLTDEEFFQILDNMAKPDESRAGELSPDEMINIIRRAT